MIWGGVEGENEDSQDDPDEDRDVYGWSSRKIWSRDYCPNFGPVFGVLPLVHTVTSCTGR